MDPTPGTAASEFVRPIARDVGKLITENAKALAEKIPAVKP